MAPAKKTARGGDRQSSGLADALFSVTQQRVLGLLLGQPGRAFTLSELIRLAGAGTGAVQREVSRLSRVGLVTVTSDGGRRYIQANPAAPIFHELRAIIEKTSGVAGQIRTALEAAGARVRLAILYGSVARGTDTAASDIDVLVVGDDLTQEAAFALFEDAERRLGRRINPTVYTSEELAQRRRDRSPFLARVLSGPHVVLVGCDDELTT